MFHSSPKKFCSDALISLQTASCLPIGLEWNSLNIHCLREDVEERTKRFL
ncbi:hypothetical protein Syun_001037 [Stephania yunnanensis]|uniref:Uncharacterized protein n=1 Tax=Stephania yunnanensis TaxID=152371 RepID=A0AAP0LCY8_9MAGN